MSKDAKIKVALVHDYIKEYGGAERVLETLHEIWSEAPVYTLVHLPEFLGPHKERLQDWDIRPLVPGWIPFTAKLISPLRLLAPFLFSRLDLIAYDVVIVSATGAYNPNLVETPKGVHFCYCHTPPRYLYGYPTAREWQKHWWGKVVGETVNFFLRKIDFLSSQRVDYFIANSKNTAQRIKKFYRREAMVIYPPVEIKSKRAKEQESKRGEYYLAGGRLARAKRIDLAVEACTKLDLPLKVFGRMFAGYGEELKSKVKSQKSKIEFLGEVTDEEKAELFAGCQAFIFPAEEEDFGITPVEAMAAGKPVIAYRSGGVVESVIEGKTGEFFPPATLARSASGRGDEPTVESLMSVLRNFRSEKYKEDDCIVQAQKFSKERFKREIKEFVEKKWTKFRLA